MLIKLCLDLICDQPTIGNAVVTSQSNVSYKSRVDVQCNTGYSFKETDASKNTVTAVCSADRTWQVDAESQHVTNVLPEQCTRKKIIITLSKIELNLMRVMVLF